MARLHSSLAALAFVATPLFVAAALRLGHDPVAAEAAAPLIHREGGLAGASACRDCHPDHHESWRRTFHATMTQRPSPETIAGPFDGAIVRYEGAEGRPFRCGERFCMELPATGGGRRVAEVALAVGSRRYQQYFERAPDGGAYVRLPLLWHIGDRRWLHVNAVFLEPDDPDWDAHRSTWNDNCIYCHNTAPSPGMTNLRDPARPREGGRFDSRVGDLGIACESCHGPGQDHAAARRDPLGRYRLHLAGGADPTIVDPKRLDPERAVSLCGQCHGARLPQPLERIGTWLTSGPTFRAGGRLVEHAAPITADTRVRGGADPDLFRLRFWGDGTPRLTAYELQGLIASACYRRGGLTCEDCHAMHTGDPHGQLRPDRPGETLCANCHQDIARDPAVHTHHRAGGAGSSCVECHMPRIVYGVLEIHRSHRIDSPHPRRDAEAGRPHACTLCHVDRTLAWSAAALRRWYGDRFPDPERRRDGAPLDLPEAAASLLAGDAAMRAVYAAALGRATISAAAGADAPLRSWLAVTLGDGYPSVRWLARRSLRAIEARTPIGIADALAEFDPTTPVEERRRAVFAILRGIAAKAPGRLAQPVPEALVGADFRLDLGAVVALTDLQGRDPIAIGE